MNVADLLSAHAGPSSRVGADKTALVYGERRVSYRELDARANRVAHLLQKHGIGKGERVAVLAYNCAEYFDLYFGCARAGAILVPINFRLAPPEILAVLDDARPRLVVYGHELRTALQTVVPECRWVERWIRLGGERDAYEAALAEQLDGAPSRADVALGDDLMILYSSGTTGTPKGSVWTHDNALWFAAIQVAEFKIERDDVTLIVCPLYNCGGLAEWSIPTLLRGGTCVILPSRGFSARGLMEAIQRERVTVTLFLPVMLYDLLQLPDLDRFDASSLRFVLAGGEPLPPAVYARVMEAFPNLAFVEGYGLTEGTPIATFVRPGDLPRKLGSVGQPLLGVEVRVVDDDAQEVPVGESGEVIVRSPVVCRRYWNDPEQSARTFRDGFCFTGDVGHLDEEGFLYLTGRKKDMIISGAENVYPAEVENVLYGNPAVLEAAVIGVPHPRWGETVVAVVALRDGMTASADELIAWCGQHLAGYKRPRRVELVERLPRSTMHKVLKEELRARFAADAEG
jgi:fatty-acyl-CoA synthase